MTVAETLSLLLDPKRLMVAGALVGVQRTSTELTAQTGLNERDVLEAVGALQQAGLTENLNGSYTLPITTLHRLGNEVSESDLPMDPYIGYAMNTAERAVLARYFQGRTLAEIPKNRAKRLIVLERLALEFDLGRRYPEPSVNAILRAFHPDYATLRRYLIDEDLLSRDQGEYWRSGGRVQD